ncbi:copper resistance CopC family protein [Nonomuraea sp. KM90]|uniref:copper resistance CopC family protein n=1 Tax=Nonomuraea sp. KM90 TaxID=3457428 RepID=UPI003FCDEE2A
MKKSRLAALTAILTALLVLGTAATAVAHDSLKRSNPAKDATVKSVDEVELEFTAKVRMPYVLIRGAGDVQHQQGEPAIDGPIVRQKLKTALPDGQYTIAYRVVSSDGHPIEGEIPFRVTRAGKPFPTADPTTTTTAALAPTAQASAQESTSLPVWLLLTMSALAVIGLGFMLSARKKKP